MTGATQGMTKSYNSSSLPQRAAVQASIPFIQQAIEALDVTSSTESPLIVADFGSSQGLNSIYAMKIIIEYFRKTKKDMREPLVVHNDLPTNDWISVFQLLIADNSYKSVASGRSFYEQCLPNNSLSIGYSSTSIHWLSTKPCNITDHCYSSFTLDLKEREAFKHQAYLDYCQFLEHRSRELVPGGVLILAILCTNDKDHTDLEDTHRILYKCAQAIPMSQKELLDYTIPYYFRSYEECIDEKLFSQCSFELINSDFVSLKSPLFKQWQTGQMTSDEYADSITWFVRSWSELILQQTLINHGRAIEDIPQIINQFWNLYKEEAKQKLDNLFSHINYTFVVLKKKAARV